MCIWRKKEIRMLRLSILSIITLSFIGCGGIETENLKLFSKRIHADNNDSMTKPSSLDSNDLADGLKPSGRNSSAITIEEWKNIFILVNVENDTIKLQNGKKEMLVEPKLSFLVNDILEVLGFNDRREFMIYLMANYDIYPSKNFSYFHMITKKRKNDEKFK